MNLKYFTQKYFYYLSYFYRYLRYRLVLTLSASVLVGLLDGIGLALFIPLLKAITNGNGSPPQEEADLISSLILQKLHIDPTVINIFLLILLFFTLKGIAKFAEAYLRVVYQQYFMRKIRVSHIELLSRFDFQHFVQSDPGRIQNTLSGEVNRINTGYRFYLKSIQMSVLVVVYLLLALGADWKFSILVIAGGLVVNQLMDLLYKRTKYLSRRFTSKSHVFQNLLLQMVQMFKYLKATGLIEKYGEKLKRNIRQIEGVQHRIGLLDAALVSVREPLIILVVFGAVFFNMFFFGEGMGGILFSLLLLYRAITYYMGSQEQYNLFLGVSGSIDNMQEFTKELELGRERRGNRIFKDFQEKLVLRDLSFSFQSDNPLIRGINLEIRKNETVAIVGESGSGKTTLLNLISGLLVPTAGTYEIDGTPIGQIDPVSFRQRIGYMVQDPAIFNDTIFNNITFWADKTPENMERFHRAVKGAAISDFIATLPEKEESLLGNNGINISGGQKQRLSIARELFKEVDFLFMDEATSALDSETERIVQASLQELKGQFTVVLIAHRLATVKHANRIILLKNGQITGMGSFSELYSVSEEFKEMVNHQNL